MKGSGRYIILTGLILAAGAACKKAYNPTLSTVSLNYLAVDGPIISGDSTFIKLSRTTSLSDTTQNKAELKAVVTVEDDKSTLYPLKETGKGNYVLGLTNFDATRKYRLDIKTTDGKIYQSDFVPMKITPSIDSIYFKQTGDATVLFYVNAHDAHNNTRYYRWDYKETWSYVPLYQAFYQYKNGQIVPIVSQSSDDIATCYRTDLSNQVFVGSSNKLAQDVIANQQIGGIAAGSEKIGHVYAMQLRQYALTEDGFNYYQNIKSNTENLGSIFDAQPSFITGNIHCINSPTEKVVGFISASTVTTKQYNLHYSDIQLRITDLYGAIQWIPYHSYSTYYFLPPDTSVCHTNNFTDAHPVNTFNTIASHALSKGDSLMVDKVPIPFTPYSTYYYAPKNCVDCRLKGGTNIRPSYFPPY